jgi:hypothetical protein
MSNSKDFIKSGLERLLNSSFIKDIYPMVDHIVVDKIDLDNFILVYTVFLNISDINYNTMYDNGFDPHYLNDHHVKEALTFFSLKLPFRSFDVYKKNGNYLVGFLDNGTNQIFYKEGIHGMKVADLF